MSTRGRVRSWFDDLPLFWKLLVPFLALMVIVGTAGGFRIVHELAARAEAEIDQALIQRSLNVRALLHDRELYLLESVNFAANLQGMAAAIEAHEPGEAHRLLTSVRRLKQDLDLAAVVDEQGRTLATSGSKDRPSVVRWDRAGLVARALAERSARRFSGIVGTARERTLAIAGPVCTARQPCAPVGAAVVGMRLADVLEEAFARTSEEGATDTALALLFGGEPVTAGAWLPPDDVPPVTTGTSRRQTFSRDGRGYAILYTPYQIQGARAGVLAVQTPTSEALASARRAALQLGLLLIISMAGVVAIGAFLSRVVVGRVDPLVRTVERLGSGELDARASGVSTDEIGVLAAGINQMAGQLQTSHETLEARVQERTEDVERLLAQRNELFASISHELRTPLAIILNQAGILEEAAPDDPTVANAGRRIVGSAREVLAVVEEILDFARAEAGMLTLLPESVSVREVLEDIVPTLQPLFEHDRLALSIRLPNLPRVHADPRRLRTILANLLDNAIKYTPSGGRVQVRARRVDSAVEVSVADTGVGVPPDARGSIFEPFFRAQGTAPVRGQPSTGLGLALTRRLVEAHGGTITFHPGPKSGSTFRFTIPVASSSHETAPHAATV